MKIKIKSKGFNMNKSIIYVAAILFLAQVANAQYVNNPRMNADSTNIGEAVFWANVLGQGSNTPSNQVRISSQNQSTTTKIIDDTSPSGTICGGAMRDYHNLLHPWVQCKGYTLPSCPPNYTYRIVAKVNWGGSSGGDYVEACVKD